MYFMAVKNRENVLVLWFIHILKNVHLLQLLYKKGKELDLGAEPPSTKLYWVRPPPLPLGPVFAIHSV